ncbi:MAG: RraA family protein [Micromonosporaceae bacterium]
MRDETVGLSTLDTCTVSDALDRLRLPGAVTGLQAITAGWRIAGRVITVELNAAGGVSAQVAGKPRRHLGTAAIEAAAPGNVIVVAAGGRTDAAGWGGILSAAAVARGVAGVIVDGACRDVDEARALGFPVYARASVPRTARGRLAEVGWNEPVHVAGVSVAPGDYVVADGSGVVFVPADHAAAVVAAAHEIAAREAEMIRRIRAGEPVSRVLSADYEDMLASRDEPE